MKTPRKASIHQPSTLEQLESRIAPAALVVAEINHGKLTLTGDDGGDQIYLTQVAPGHFNLAGSGGTQVQLGSNGVPGSMLDVTGVTGDIIFTAGTGKDLLVVKGLPLAKGLHAQLGDGGAEVYLYTSLGGGLDFTGGTGDDRVSISGSKVSIAGGVSLAMGDGVNHADFYAANLTIGGGVHVTGGAGDDLINFSGNTLKIKGDVTVDTGGATTQNSFSINDTQAALGGSLVITGGAGADVTVVNSVAFSLAKNLTVNDGDGMNSISLAGDRAMIGGSVSLKNGANPLAVLELVRAKYSRLAIGQDLTIENGTGPFSSRVEAAVLTIGGSVHATSGDTAAGSAFALHGGLTATVGGSFSIAAGTGAYSGLVDAGNNLVIKGDVTATTGDHTGGYANVSFSAGRTLSLGGDVAMQHGPGGSGSSLYGGNQINVAGSVSVAGGPGADSVYITGGDIAVRGGALLDCGAGGAFVQLQADHVLSVGGDLEIHSTSAVSSVYLQGESARFGGAVTLDYGASTSVLAKLVATHGTLSIAHGLSIQAGSSGDTSTALQAVAVGGQTNIVTGGGVDYLNIDGARFAQVFSVDTGDGDDHVNIDTIPYFGLKPSVFAQSASIALGAGDHDSVGLGSVRKSIFAAAVSFDGGAGLHDSIFDFAAVIYQQAGQPTIVNFE